MRSNGNADSPIRGIRDSFNYPRIRKNQNYSMGFLTVDPGLYELRVNVPNVTLFRERAMSVARNHDRRYYGIDVLTDMIPLCDMRLLGTHENSLTSVADFHNDAFEFIMNRNSRGAQLRGALASMSNSPFDCAITTNQFERDTSILVDGLYQENAESLLIIPSCVCWLATTGSFNGCVGEVNCQGASMTLVTEGSIMPGTMNADSSLGWKSVLNKMHHLLAVNSGYQVPSLYSFLVSDYLIRKYGFVLPVHDDQGLKEVMSNVNIGRQNTGLLLPDGSEIFIDEERYECYETLLGQNHCNLFTLVSRTLGNLDLINKANAQKNVVFAGGIFRAQGMVNRLRSYASDEFPKLSMSTVNCSASNAEKGAEIVGEFIKLSRPHFWFGRKTLEEEGVSRVLNKYAWFG